MRRYRELRRSRHSRCIYFAGESRNRDAWLGRIMRWSELKPTFILIFSQDRTIRLLLDTMFGWILPMKRRSWHPECYCAHVCPLWARRQAFGRPVAYFRPRHFRWAAIDRFPLLTRSLTPRRKRQSLQLCQERCVEIHQTVAQALRDDGNESGS
jgi:hypothetical protein